MIHRSWLALADAERTLATLAAMTNEERAAIPVMPPGRGDVIVAGAVILVRAMRRFGFERALVSETDILDGLALETAGRPVTSTADVETKHRDRQLAKLAARRQAERDAAARRRQT